MFQDYIGDGLKRPIEASTPALCRLPRTTQKLFNRLQTGINDAHLIEEFPQRISCHGAVWLVSHTFVRLGQIINQGSPQDLSPRIIANLFPFGIERDVRDRWRLTRRLHPIGVGCA